MAYTTINKSTDHFFTKLWSGTNAGETISGIPFQPDFNWTKQRTGTQDHVLVDAVRGVQKTLFSNAADAEYTLSDGITAWTSDGFTHGTNNRYCESSNTFASWSWKANGSGSSNTDGSITSTVSANTTAGFSIVKFTGTGANATIGHGLGVAPKMIIVKDISGSNQWGVYHKSLGATKYLLLETSGASGTASTLWNDTEPTSSVFTVGTTTTTNGSGNDYIAYCFAEKVGYSKFGKYSGNTSSDGTFLYCGFKPTFLIVKGTTTAESWCMFDNKRNTYNPNNTRLLANSTSTEASIDLDFLSNGIKFRTTENAVDHANTYMFMAFGQTIVGSNDIPCTAR